MIDVKNLSKTYIDRKAVDNITFQVNKGEILGFLGPNGAGKTTTMKILSGFINASEGTAMVNGFDVKKETMNAKAAIGYLPETPPVYLGMEVEDYLRFAARLHKVSKKNLKQAVESAMERVGVIDVRHRLIGNLSKGYRQRVGLAQAIAHNPPVLILDEPTVGLDPKQIIEIRNLIRSLRNAHTVILSTHILPEVQAACDRVVVIDHGRIVADDRLENIINRAQGSVRVHLQLQNSPSENFLQKLKNLSGVTLLSTNKQREAGEYILSLEFAKGKDLRSNVAELCVQERLGLLGLYQEKVSLEDAFVKLVTKDSVGG